MAFESKVIKSDALTTIATIAVDTVSGVDYPVSQIIVGADGAAKTIVSGTTGLPVTGVYSEDVATPNPIVGQAMLMERDDALSTLTPAAGDWAGMRCDANGALWVSLSATASTAVTNAGTFAVQSTLQAGSAAFGKLAANSGVDIGDVDILSVITGTAATNLGKAEDAGHSSGDVGVMALSVRQNTAASTSGSDGDYQPLITDTNGRLHVIDVTAAPTVHAEDDAVISGHSGVLAMVQRKDTPSSGAGTNADGDYTFLRVSNYGGLWIQEIDPIEGTGDIAHDAADSGKPQKIGYKAIAHGSNPSAVAANDRTNAYANRHGVPWVIGGHPNVIARTARVTDADGAQTDTAMITISGGSKIVITRISIVCDNANTGDTNCTVGFAASSLPSDAHTGTDDILADFQGVPAGGGITIGDGSGILGVGADGEDLRYTCEDPAGGSIVISVSYYTVES